MKHKVVFDRAVDIGEHLRGCGVRGISVPALQIDVDAVAPRIFLHDADDFREDRLEVSSSVGAECTRDIFPDHPSWSNKLACPSIACIVLSQLLYYADLFIEQL